MPILKEFKNQKKLNAFVTETLESALEQAKKADEINQKMELCLVRRLRLRIYFVLKMFKLLHQVKF